MTKILQQLGITKSQSPAGNNGKKPSLASQDGNQLSLSIQPGDDSFSQGSSCSNQQSQSAGPHLPPPSSSTPTESEATTQKFTFDVERGQPSAPQETTKQPSILRGTLNSLANLNFKSIGKGCLVALTAAALLGAGFGGGYATGRSTGGSTLPSGTPTATLSGPPKRGEFPAQANCHTSHLTMVQEGILLINKPDNFTAPRYLKYTTKFYDDSDGAIYESETPPPSIDDVYALCEGVFKNASICYGSESLERLGYLGHLAIRQPRLILDIIHQATFEDINPANSKPTKFDGLLVSVGDAKEEFEDVHGEEWVPQKKVPLPVNLGPRQWPLTMLLATATAWEHPNSQSSPYNTLRRIANQNCSLPLSSLQALGFEDSSAPARQASTSAPDCAERRRNAVDLSLSVLTAGPLESKSDTTSQQRFMQTVSAGHWIDYNPTNLAAFHIMRNPNYFTLVGPASNESWPEYRYIVTGAKDDKVLVEPLDITKLNGSHSFVTSEKEILAGKYRIVAVEFGCPTSGSKGIIDPNGREN